MGIEVWSDVVCPWCFIGKRRPEGALASAAEVANVEIVHRAFQLDPRAITAGQKTVEVLSTKYGLYAAGAQRMLEQVTEAAKSENLGYRLAETTSGNTSVVHQILLWAQSQGVGQELLPFIIDAGLDPEEAREVISAGSFLTAVQSDQDQAGALGATGVPFSSCSQIEPQLSPFTRDEGVK